MELAALANTYFDYKKPWLMIKDPSKRKEIETFFAVCLDTIKNLALISSPIIPKAAQEIWEMLGFSSLLEKQIWDEVVERPLLAHHHLPEPKILFRKIEDEEIEKEIQNLHKKTNKETAVDKPVIVDKKSIEFSDFEKLDLRVGQIIHAESVEKSKKLLKLKVDVGTEVRQIIAGIALSYKPEQLLGKKVAVLTNIKPIKIMGLESFGMLLVAGEEILELPTFQTVMPGSKIC
jgi:methionyl-tRNA synthetase